MFDKKIVLIVIVLSVFFYYILNINSGVERSFQKLNKAENYFKMLQFRGVIINRYQNHSSVFLEIKCLDSTVSNININEFLRAEKNILYIQTSEVRSRYIDFKQLGVGDTLMKKSGDKFLFKDMKYKVYLLGEGTDSN